MVISTETHHVNGRIGKRLCMEIHRVKIYYLFIICIQQQSHVQSCLWLKTKKQPFYRCHWKWARKSMWQYQANCHPYTLWVELLSQSEPTWMLTFTAFQCTDFIVDLTALLELTARNTELAIDLNGPVCPSDTNALKALYLNWACIRGTKTSQGYTSARNSTLHYSFLKKHHPMLTNQSVLKLGRAGHTQFEIVCMNIETRATL